MSPARSHPCLEDGFMSSLKNHGSKVNAIGALETRSIALGIEAADAMSKAAEIKLLTASATCPGKYLVVFCGSVAAVHAAMSAGTACVGEAFSDSTVIPSVHPEVIPALSAMSQVDDIKALGVIETFTMASAITAADEAVKSADVHLIEIRLGRGLAGKAFVVLTGEVAAVRSAVTAAVNALSEEAMLLGYTVIAAPHPELIDKIL